MKLKLWISEKFVNAASGPKKEFVFTVLNLDRSENYPENFVCLLPKKPESGSNPVSKFFEIFGEESRQIAKGLLLGALKSERDMVVKEEIQKRLKLFEPKEAVTANCIACGCVFEPKKIGYHLQRLCQECRAKNQMH
jgi:hypothetical protein